MEAEDGELSGSRLRVLSLLRRENSGEEEWEFDGCMFGLWAMIVP